MDHQAILGLMDTPFGDSIVHSIARAYRVCSLAHDPSIGNNAMTYGMCVRFAVEKFLDDVFAADPQIRISRPSGSFQLALQSHVFHFYKFGTSVEDTIDHLSFDDSTTKISIITDNQLALPGLPKLRHVVIAHSGNPVEGLREVYIGAPHTFGNHGSPWAWRHLVYTATNQSPEERNPISSRDVVQPLSLFST